MNPSQHIWIAVVAFVAMAIAPTQTSFLLAPPEGRGCCSHHQGQCGCQGNRIVCCDNTMSPTCTCN
jgi:hypothetical protein